MSMKPLLDLMNIRFERIEHLARCLTAVEKEPKAYCILIVFNSRSAVTDVNEAKMSVPIRTWVMLWGNLINAKPAWGVLLQIS